MKKRTGLTLVEVIISLMIISLVIVGLLGFFANGYQNILNLRKRNVNNAEVQAFFEEKLSDAKRNGIPDTDPDIQNTTFTYRVNNGTSQSINVAGKMIKYPDANRKISLFVAKRKEAVLEIPEDVKVTIPNARTYYYVGERIPAARVDVNNSGGVSALSTIQEESWFLSHREIGDSKVVTVGSLANQAEGSQEPYAVMPIMGDARDAALINQSKSGFTISDQMRGKYITYGARLINTYGRVGAYHMAPRVWVLGLPVRDSLVAHSDADLATRRDGSPIAPDPNATTDTQVLNLVNNTPLNQTIPVLSVQEDAIGQIRQHFALNNNPMKLTGVNASNATTTTFLLSNRRQAGELFSYELDSTMGWKLSADENGNLTIGTYDTTRLNAANTSQTITGRSMSYNQDNVITIQTIVSGTTIRVVLSVNGNQWASTSMSLRGTVSGRTITHNINSSAISFSGNSFINEFAIYQKALSNTELNRIMQYYTNKYSKAYNE